MVTGKDGLTFHLVDKGAMIDSVVRKVSNLSPRERVRHVIVTTYKIAANNCVPKAQEKSGQPGPGGEMEEEGDDEEEQGDEAEYEDMESPGDGSAKSLLDLRYIACIADEAHAVTSPTASAHVALAKLMSQSSSRLLMTATPMSASVTELAFLFKAAGSSLAHDVHRVPLDKNSDSDFALASKEIKADREKYRALNIASVEKWHATDEEPLIQGDPTPEGGITFAPISNDLERTALNQKIGKDYIGSDSVGRASMKLASRFRHLIIRRNADNTDSSGKPIIPRGKGNVMVGLSRLRIDEMRDLAEIIRREFVR